jgi:hypothetical protein
MRNTLPTSKNSLILFNNFKSFLFKLITNLQATRQPNLYLLSFIIVNINEPSPSVNPVINQGFSLESSLE